MYACMHKTERIGCYRATHLMIMWNNYRDTIIRLTMQMNKINLKRFTKLFVMDGAEKEQTLIDICMAFIKINLKGVKLYVQ